MPWVVRFPPIQRAYELGRSELWLQVEQPDGFGAGYPIFRAVGAEALATRWDERAEVVALVMARSESEQDWRPFVIEEVSR